MLESSLWLGVMTISLSVIEASSPGHLSKILHTQVLLAGWLMDRVTG